MKKGPKKRWFALILLALMLVLFYRSTWMARMIYPISYREEINQNAMKYKVDPLLIAAIIRVESNYKPNLESHRGAIGIMQIMPDTAQWIFQMEGIASNTLKDDLHDPAFNIRIGTRYLGLLNEQYRNNMILVAASYNAGPGNVNKWLENRIWDGRAETVEDIPFWETKKYVNKVLYYYKIYTEIYADD